MSKGTERTVHQVFGPDWYGGLDLEEATDPEQAARIAQADVERTQAGTVRRSGQANADAFEQVQTRRWYLRGASQRLAAPGLIPEQRVKVAAAIESIETEFPDVGEPVYDNDISSGYLAGVQSALAWVLGCEGALPTHD